jgi:16S rRNA (uracil1498-N3)-methyltransferase
VSTPPLFFGADLDADPVVLGGPEAHHAIAVRRLRIGEPVLVSDGRGGLVTGAVAAAGPDRLEVHVVHRERVPPPPWRLVVVQALAKGGRDLQAVEAMTEVGVDAFVPWAAARAVAQWRGERTLGRWQATAAAAAKQARRAWFPEVGDCATTAQVATRLQAAAVGIVLDRCGEIALGALSPPASGEVVAVVGPEGGFDELELQAFRGAGAVVARLGSSVVRASTAGVAAAAVLLDRGGRWR